MYLLIVNLEQEFLKMSSFVPAVEWHFRSLSRLSLIWMPTAAQPVLCGEPLDCRQHAVEMSAMGEQA